MMACFSWACDGVHLRAATASCRRNAAERVRSGSGTASARRHSGADAALVPLRQGNTPSVNTASGRAPLRELWRRVTSEGYKIRPGGGDSQESRGLDHLTNRADGVWQKTENRYAAESEAPDLTTDYVSVAARFRLLPGGFLRFWPYVQVHAGKDGAVFCRHAPADGRYELLTVAARGKRQQLVEVQFQTPDSEPFQPLQQGGKKEHAHVNDTWRESRIYILIIIT